MPGLNEAVDRYFGEMLAVNEAFMELTALALDMPRDHFSAAFAGRSWLNRLRWAYYPSQKHAPPKGDQLRARRRRDGTASTRAEGLVPW